MICLNSSRRNFMINLFFMILIGILQMSISKNILISKTYNLQNRNQYKDVIRKKTLRQHKTEKSLAERGLQLCLTNCSRIVCTDPKGETVKVTYVTNLMVGQCHKARGGGREIDAYILGA